MSSLRNISAMKIIDALRSGDQSALDNLYLELKPAFMDWCYGKYKLNEADSLDVWQDTIIAFYEQTVSGKLTKLEVSLKTYLFSIAKNKILNRFRTAKNLDKKHDKYLEIKELQLIGYDELDDIKKDQQAKISGAMDQLSPKARKILIMRYYDNLSLESIMKNEGYQNKNALSASLSRAVSKLKEIVNQKYILISMLSFLLQMV